MCNFNYSNENTEGVYASIWFAVLTLPIDFELFIAEKYLEKLILNKFQSKY